LIKEKKEKAVLKTISHKKEKVKVVIHNKKDDEVP
jgi:hypothetical protein